MDWKLCLTAAGAICAAAVLVSLILWLDRKGTSKGRLYLLASGAFAATFVLLLPYVWEKELPDFSKIMLCFHTTVQAFTFDIPAEDIITEITAREGLFFAWYGRAIALMVIVCPLFTIGIILSFFKSFWPRVLVAIHWRRDAYVFSELNEMTLAFAKSVVRQSKTALIVFADAYSDKDDNAALLEEAEALHACCFRDSVTHLPFRKYRKSAGTRRWVRKLDFVLLSADQDQALTQGLELQKLYENRPRATATVYSASAVAGMVIDSMTDPKVPFTDTFLETLRTNPDDLWNRTTWDDVIDRHSGFYLRRFNPVQQTVLTELTNEDLIKDLDDASKSEGVISILIAGFGSFGNEFLKNAVWLYQRLGCRVEINVVDSRSEEALAGVFRQACPELMEDVQADGNAAYSIRFLPETDVFSASFDARFSAGDDLAQRLNRTQIVFVTLGDDERNIAAAMRLRTMFDRLRPERLSNAPINKLKKALKETENDRAELEQLKDQLAEQLGRPRIEAVVFDEEKYWTGQGPDSDNPLKGLRNHKDQPYFLTFIGNLAAQYSVDALKTYETWENEALMRHLEWMQVSHSVNYKYHTDEGFRTELTALYAQRYPELDEDALAAKIRDALYDPLYELDENNRYRLIQPGENDPQPEEHDYRVKLNTELLAYYHFEYCRFSSIAKNLYQKAVAKRPSGACDPLICTCGECQAKRMAEHMRWNVYLKSIGYRRGDPRFDRAKLHPDIVPFEELDPMEQLKD